MFQLAQKNTCKWPVTVLVPQDGGKRAKQTFSAEFSLLPDERQRELKNGSVSDEEFLREVVVGWDGVQDADGAELPFGDEALDRLIAIPYVRAALIEAYFDFAAGGRRKN
jgi:hypothetical protein